LNTTAAYSFDGSTWVSGNTSTDSSLIPNTSYTKSTLKARDNVLNVSTASSVSKYTLAQVPVAPTTTGGYTYTNGPYVNVTLNTETPANPSTTVYAIYIEQGATCDGSGGLGYVQADGSIGPSAVWQTISSWGTKTVPHLTQATQYALCSKARNGDNVETAFGATSTVTSGAPSISITITAGSTINLGTIVPSDHYLYNNYSSTLSVTTNGNGYQLLVSDGTAGNNSSLQSGSNYIPDYPMSIASPTTWDTCSTPPCYGFGLSVYSASNKNTTQWGTGTTPTDPNNKYAAIPQTNTVINTKSGYSASADTTGVAYAIKLPSSQPQGAYSGTITYTIVGTP
jgi:hypothetical protein